MSSKSSKTTTNHVYPERSRRESRNTPVLSVVEGNTEPRTTEPHSIGASAIELTWGKYAIVDAEDYDRISVYKWCAVRKRNTWYARTFRRDGAPLSMHRLIAGAPKGLIVDHIDHNGLNNRKYNLRLCTNAQNQYNRLPLKGATSRHKGVSRCKSHNKYNAYIYHKSKRYHLGWFVDENDAARAYDKKARELFGEFAYLNFPDQ